MRIAAWICGRSSAGVVFATVVALGSGGLTAVTIEAVVRARLDGAHLTAPTRFYARPLILAPGKTVARERVASHLDRLGYERTRRSRVRVGEYRLDARRWVIGRRAFRHYDRLDPGGVMVADVGGDRIWRLRDDDGRRMDAVALEPELIRAIDGDRFDDRLPVRLADMPDQLVSAVLAVEDQRFLSHHGLDARRIAGAMLANVRAGHIVQGASTITQQLAKNLFLSARRSPVRKVREWAMALLLEARYDKSEILEAYLNEVYLGQDGAYAIHGVGRAAQFYFGKDVSQLDLAESALLAGIIRGPSLYAPFRRPDAAIARRNLVLDLMHQQAVIPDEAYRQARSTELALHHAPPPGRHGRYFVDYIAAQLRRRHGRDALQQGMAVFTTLDMGLQQAAERAVGDGLRRLERDHPRLVRDSTLVQAALVAIDPRSGAILAMVGGRDYGRSQFNRAAQARRQPGSAFKPIVALAALSHGDDKTAPNFTLASVLDDTPLSVTTPAGSWEPQNYDRRFRGAVTLRDALERSLNVPFARLGLAIGPDRVVATARRLGIEGPLTAVPSIALGSNEVSPLELTRAYGVLAAGGVRVDLSGTIGVFDHTGQFIEQPTRRAERVFDAAEAYLVTSALRGAVERGTGRSLRRLGLYGAVAAKSGTTNGFRDAWFIGYTPTITVGVWVGFDDGASLGLPGSRAALPIFAAFLRSALGPEGEAGDFQMPTGVEVREISVETGPRAGRGCQGLREVFLRGTAPVESCARWPSSWSRYSATARRWYRDELTPLVRDLRRRARRRRGD